MFFNRNIEPSCSYCKRGLALGYNEYICSLRGVVTGDGFCSSFIYEPTKREPEAMPRLKAPELSEEDFVI